MAPLALTSLPPEVLAHIVLQLVDMHGGRSMAMASTLAAVEQTSHGLGAATSSAWEAGVKKWFPRVVELLRLASPAAAPSYRELFRRQLVAERDVEPRRLSLDDFIFTIEITRGEGESYTWTGKYGDRANFFGYG